MPDNQYSQELISFGKRVKDLRKEKGWTQEELADEAGIGRATIQRIEMAKHVPSLTQVFALAQAFGIIPGDLLVSH